MYNVHVHHVRWNQKVTADSVQYIHGKTTKGFDRGISLILCTSIRYYLLFTGKRKVNNFNTV